MRYREVVSIIAFCFFELFLDYVVTLQNGYYRQFRKNMVEASDGNDFYELDRAIVLFEKHRLEDRGDLTRAKERREFLKLKKGLYSWNPSFGTLRVDVFIHIHRQSS